MKRFGICLVLALAVVLPLTVRLARETIVMEQKAVGQRNVYNADFNCDNKVDEVDFEIWRRNKS